MAVPGIVAYAWFPPFRCRFAVPLTQRRCVVLPFRCTVAVACENGIGGNVFPLTPLTAFEEWPERWLAVQLRKNGKNRIRIRSYWLRHNGSWNGNGATEFFHVGLCNVIRTALTEFLRNFRNVNGETATAERQRNGGNQALDSWNLKLQYTEYSPLCTICCTALYSVTTTTLPH